MIYKKFLQYDELDCAAAALSTVLSRFKNKVSLHEVKKECIEEHMVHPFKI